MTEDSIPMNIPEGISYNCQGCGRCCSGFSVGMSLKDYDKVKDVDWGKLHPQLSGLELFTHKEKEFAEGTSLFPIYTKAHPDGACPFLINDLCFIHGTLGESEKPSVCQIFPYTFVGTPRGVFAAVSLSSMASVRNIGRPLTEQRPMLEQTLQLMKDLEVELKKEGAKTDVTAAVGGINLTSGVAITWDEYFLIEDRLMSIAKHEPFENTFQMWTAACEVLTEAARLKIEGANLDNIAEFKPDLSFWNNKISTAFERFLLILMCFRGLTWPMLKRRRIQNNQKPASGIEMFGSVLNALASKKMELPNCGEVNIEEAMFTPFVPLSAEINQFMRQYMYLRLFSKTYFGASMGGFSVIAGFNQMVATILTSLTFAKACAVKRGQNEVQIADIYESILLLDKQLGLISSLSGQVSLIYDHAFASPRIFNRFLSQMGSSFSSRI